jgi:hypothetical protein
MRLRSFGTAWVLAGAVACSSAPVVTPARQAERFVAALNADSVDVLLAVSRDQFAFRSQSWESAPGGEGFVLGAVQDRSCSDEACRRRLFEELVRSVEIEGATAADTLAAGDSTLAEYLKGAPPAWSHGVEWFLFLRGSADVEHIALVGVDPRLRKVAVLYVN